MLLDASEVSPLSGCDLCSVTDVFHLMMCVYTVCCYGGEAALQL